MKLRNKKAGEIIICSPIDIYGFRSLAEVNENWEDYEEPETYYFLSDLGNIESLTNDHGHNLPEEIWHRAIKRKKEIGNYFETQEDAEKAVEKLKAWKRLKDKGFMCIYHEKGLHFKAEFDMVDKPLFDCALQKDLDLLFGGEE